MPMRHFDHFILRKTPYMEAMDKALKSTLPTSRPASLLVKDARQCETMTEVRAGVDAIDRQLVTLIAKRQAYMHAAARIKQSREMVYDAARIEDIIVKVLGLARKAGLSEQIAEPIWREMIKQCIAHEFRVWDNTKG
jgi:isochorismate pyruvate lyase